VDFVLNLHSTRAKRARYAAAFGKKWFLISCKLIAFTSLALGVALLVSDQPLGWLVLLPFSMTTVFLLFQKGDLSDHDFGTINVGNTIQLHEALELEILEKLSSEEPSAYDLWKALESSEERFFIGNRYLIDSSFFEQFLGKNSGSATAVWQKAESYRTEFGLNGYTNMVILVSLIATVPNIEQILKSVRLSLKDVETAIPWMRDVLEKRRLAHTKQAFGGIGRDWAYGYTPLLRYLGYNISQDIELHGFFSDTSMHERIVEQMVQTMSSGNGTITLVGEAGVGKTTCVHAFAERLLTDATAPKIIRYNLVVELDAPTLIANAKSPGQLEELMLRLIKEAHRAKNIILFFDDAEAFFGSGTGSVDLSHVLQPAIENSNVRLVLAMSPQAWQRLSGTSVIGRLQPINVAPADEENTLAVLRDSISLAEYRNKAVFTYQALREGYKLGGRYVTNQAMPGAALSLLEQAATIAGQQLITREVVQTSVEQAYGIKLRQAEGGESSQLLNLEEELRKYVISQDRAVTVVADALRRARSGVGNPNRPVGTFLFLGPTGVGKTELSKALARVYYGDESSLIRVDMNQYVGAKDVSRLISPMAGSDLGFLGQVRKQPFSVILLDEIEKAHSSVVNALLQMLDEGVMKDSDSKNVSFKDAIIIATSNAGADEIRKMIDSGEAIDEKAEAKFVETLISRGSFAPEFINRFDEVVIFKPLDQNELVQVIDLIMGDINKTLDAQKVQVELTDDAKKWLVDKGYDSKLGARPMRRMAQRYVENTVAKRLLEQSVVSGGVIKLDAKDFE
jgi:ATP-dependent Clp protease ATP-binding subunit ClpC